MANIHLQAGSGCGKQVHRSDTGGSSSRKDLHGVGIKAGIEPEMSEKLNKKRSSRSPRPGDNDVASNHGVRTSCVPAKSVRACCQWLRAELNGDQPVADSGQPRLCKWPHPRRRFALLQ